MMKRLVITCIAMFLLLLLCGCELPSTDADQDGTDADVSDEDSSSETEDTPTDDADECAHEYKENVLTPPAHRDRDLLR